MFTDLHRCVWIGWFILRTIIPRPAINLSHLILLVVCICFRWLYRRITIKWQRDFWRWGKHESATGDTYWSNTGRSHSLWIYSTAGFPETMDSGRFYSGHGVDLFPLCAGENSGRAVFHYVVPAAFSRVHNDRHPAPGLGYRNFSALSSQRCYCRQFFWSWPASWCGSSPSITVVNRLSGVELKQEQNARNGPGLWSVNIKRVY